MKAPAPLRRFLRSNVGRPWDKVYSEVCERINRDSAVQYHVWQHLMQDVCRDPHEVLGYVGRSRFFGPSNKFYGRSVYAIRKRQLNKKEIRRLPHLSDQSS